MSLLIFLLALLAEHAQADRLMTGGSIGSTDTIVSQNENAVGEAVSLIDNGNYEAAIETLLSLTSTVPQQPEVFNQLGYAHSQLQNYDLSLEFYRKALKINPEHAGALAYMGKVYIELGKITAAEDHLRQLDLICLFGCEPFSTLQEAILLYYANEGK